MDTVSEDRVTTTKHPQPLNDSLPQSSQTASEYINEQLALEADAKEILPYKFDKCTNILGPLRQSVFACLTCSPPPASAAQVYTPAGVCYSCSISCHGEHNLVELFHRRNFVCDCGTSRFPSTSPCQLRVDASTGKKGVASQEAARGNTYNHNYQNKFCGCGEDYDADTERGTMYQCIGLGTVETGGCGEDWWHAECLMGLPRDWLAKGLAEPRPQKRSDDEDAEPEHPVPMGFPDDQAFTSLICYKCVESNPWIKQYAGTAGFLPPLKYQRSESTFADPGAAAEHKPSLKRKASRDEDAEQEAGSKRLKEEIKPSALLGQSTTAVSEKEDTALIANSEGASASTQGVSPTSPIAKQKHDDLPPASDGTFSILAQDGFRDKFCRCPQCFPNLIPHPQLQEEEDEYEPSISDSEGSLVGGGSASGTRSVGTASLLDRGEAALNTMDRVKAIEGVMVYNHLKDKVKAFLKPYAETGQVVSADDIKEYFEKLRGDHEAVKEASTKPVPDDRDGDNRGEQSGY